MKLFNAALSLLTVSALDIFSIYAQEEAPGMTKMCLFYPSPSGHARSDPILNQSCASDHVHTFYGKYSQNMVKYYLKLHYYCQRRLQNIHVCHCKY